MKLNKMKSLFLEEFIKNSKTCVISSIDEDGFPQSRAMLGIRNNQGLQHFYFSTNTSSQKVQQFKKNEKACLYFYNAKLFIGVMCIWTMEVSQKEEDKNLVRKQGDEMYYPKGFEDPDFCVLKFTTKKIRRYSNFKTDTFEI